MKMPEVTYEYYFSSCTGGSDLRIPPESFDGIIRRASDFLASLCIEPPDEPLTDVYRRAVCRIAEELSDASARRGIHSENTDGYSVTYSDADENALNRRLMRIAAQYLGNSGILYRGADVC